MPIIRFKLWIEGRIFFARIVRSSEFVVRSFVVIGFELGDFGNLRPIVELSAFCFAQNQAEKRATGGNRLIRADYF